MFDVGRVCVKIAGRDAGKRCVIVDTLEFPFVLVDGETRRRKVNVRHLLPLDHVTKLTKGASHDAVTKVLAGAGFTVRTTKPKKSAPRPRRVRKAKPKGPKPAASQTKPAAKKRSRKKTPQKEEVKKESTPTASQ